MLAVVMFANVILLVVTYSCVILAVSILAVVMFANVILLVVTYSCNIPAVAMLAVVMFAVVILLVVTYSCVIPTVPILPPVTPSVVMLLVVTYSCVIPTVPILPPVTPSVVMLANTMLALLIVARLPICNVLLVVKFPIVMLFTKVESVLTTRVFVLDSELAKKLPLIVLPIIRNSAGALLKVSLGSP